MRQRLEITTGWVWNKLPHPNHVSFIYIYFHPHKYIYIYIYIYYIKRSDGIQNSHAFPI